MGTLFKIGIESISSSIKLYFIIVFGCLVSTLHYISKETFISAMLFHGNINLFKSDKWNLHELNILLK